MKTRSLAGLCVVLALAGCVAGGQTTSTYRQGGSTATITQSGGGSPQTVRRVTRGPNGQTIVQRQGTNTVTIRQQGGTEAGMPDEDE